MKLGPGMHKALDLNATFILGRDFLIPLQIWNKVIKNIWGVFESLGQEDTAWVTSGVSSGGAHPQEVKAGGSTELQELERWLSQ